MADDRLDELKELAEGLPTELRGWSKSGDCALYSPRDLYEYINGGAELYISYEFENLITQPYVHPDGQEIKIDIFDMGTSPNAFGVFSHGRQSVDRFVSPAVESEYDSGLLTFWKGPYYAAILAYPETDEKRELVREFAQMICRRIKQESKKPAILSGLPPGNLIAESILYFRHAAWLNSYHFFSNQNILNIDNRTEAVMARYAAVSRDGPQAVLVLLQYPNAAEAHAAETNFRRQVMPGAVEGLAQSEDRRWAGSALGGSRVVVVANASDRGTAEALISAALSSTEAATDKGD